MIFYCFFIACDSISKTASAPTYMSQLIMDNDTTSPSYAIFSQQVGYGAVGERSSSMGISTNIGGVMLTLKLN